MGAAKEVRVRVTYACWEGQLQTGMGANESWSRTKDDSQKFGREEFGRGCCLWPFERRIANVVREDGRLEQRW